jgi:hypothetical protein
VDHSGQPVSYDHVDVTLAELLAEQTRQLRAQAPDASGTVWMTWTDW